MRIAPTMLIGAALFAGANMPAAAQTTFPTDDPVIKRIWAVGMDSSHTRSLAQSLFDSVGPRLTGSPGQKAGNDWLVHMYRSWGIDAKNEQYGTWRGWRRGISHIDLMEPRVRSLEGTMLAWSPGTGGRDVSAGIVLIPEVADSAEFARWLPAVRGKFVLVSPAMPTCRPAADWQQWATDPSRAAMEEERRQVSNAWNQRLRGTGYSLALGTGTLGLRLEAAGAAGVITSRNKDAWGTIEVFETYNLRAPAIALSCEDYGLLYRLAENNQNPIVRLNLDADLLGEVPVFNTIATIPGTEKPNEYVMLSAHFDSWDGSSGATDNGTGTLTMLEAMRILKTVYPNPKRTILVGHWSSEEQGLNGSKAWSEDHPEVVAGLQALFNQDNGTGRIQRISASGLPDMGPHLTSWMAKLPSFFTEQASFNGVGGAPRGVGGTDGAVFTCLGAPSIGLGAVSWNYSAYTWHTNRDTYDKVVFDDLKGNATLTAMLTYLASEDPAFIDRTKAEGEWPECPKAPRSTRPRM